MKQFVIIALCGWIYWHMLVVNKEYRYLPMSVALTKQECLARAKLVADYEKKWSVLRWYADLSRPSHWFGCFPEDYDPRDEGGT